MTTTKQHELYKVAAIARRVRIRDALAFLCQTSATMSATNGWYPARIISHYCGVAESAVNEDLRAMSGVECKQQGMRQLWRIK